jgi:two-component system, NarL family, response regulator DevR
MGSEQSGTKVFLLAENRLLREALARIFSKKSDIALVGACDFSPLAIERITAAGPDVLLMDSFPAVLSHLKFIPEVQLAIPGIQVVLIGMEADEQAFLQVVRAGAVGYVLKDASALEVIASVRAVANGDAVCPPQLCLPLFRYVARQCDHLPSFQVKASLGLSKREQQLVGLIGQGLTNKEIASQLNLSEQTVRNHVHRMLRKVGTSDRLAVVELCRMQGLPV